MGLLLLLLLWSLFVAGRCLLLVVVCFLLLLSYLTNLSYLSYLSYLSNLSYLSYLSYSIIIFGMLESSGFRKCSTLLLFQSFPWRLCLCHCLCDCLCLCVRIFVRVW